MGRINRVGVKEGTTWTDTWEVAGDAYPRRVITGNGTVLTGAGSVMPAMMMNLSEGTATNTITASVGNATYSHPILLAGLGTSAIDILKDWEPGHDFKLLSFDFIPIQPGAGSGAKQVFNLRIGSTNVTGGVLTAALADTTTLGVAKASTDITDNNIGGPEDTVSIKMASGGTNFTGGAGYFRIKYQNLDVANAFASLAAR